MTAPKQKGKPGPASMRTDEMVQEILDRLTIGDSLRKICGEDHMPHLATFLRWLDEDPELATRYARAREVQADVMDFKILDTADECTPENAAAARVKIDAYKWRASKLAPKKYGDKVGVEHSGGVEVTQVKTSLAERIAALSQQHAAKFGNKG